MKKNADSDYYLHPSKNGSEFSRKIYAPGLTVSRFRIAGYSFLSASGLCWKTTKKNRIQNQELKISMVWPAACFSGAVIQGFGASPKKLTEELNFLNKCSI